MNDKPIISFTIDGEPVGKGRPRAVRTKTSVRAYTPQRTADYEQKVRQAFKEAHPSFEPIKDHAVCVQISAHFGVPKSTTKKRKSLIETGTEFPTKKPDADNIAKIICDSLNGLAYKDDAQVCCLTVRKYYTFLDPHVDVRIWDLQQGE